MNCKICKNDGLKPKCPFCGRKARPKRKTNMQKIIESRERERLKMNEQAFINFKKSKSIGSGCNDFDDDVKSTHGDW
jgi:hypothetical protein